MKDKLSKEELSHLFGGVANGGSLPGGSSSNIPNGVDVGVDIRNINTVTFCVCEYDNSPQTIFNENGVETCKCVCWPR